MMLKTIAHKQVKTHLNQLATHPKVPRFCLNMNFKYLAVILEQRIRNCGGVIYDPYCIFIPKRVPLKRVHSAWS